MVGAAVLTIKKAGCGENPHPAFVLHILALRYRKTT